MKKILILMGFALLTSGLVSCEGSNGRDAEEVKNLIGSAKNDSSIVEKYWKLIEIEGQEIIFSDDWVREPHLILKAEEKRVSGNTSCNSFFGTYEITEGQRIRFTEIGATEMACKEMEVEQQLFEVLELADNYSIHNDSLSLNKARRAPLAKFVAVYLN